MTIIKDLVLIFRTILKLFGLFKVSHFTNNQIGIFMLVLAFVISSYSFYEVIRVPKIIRHDVAIDDLPKELDGTTVVQLTDLHMSALNTKPFAEGVVQKVNSLDPDMVLITGDFVDGYLKDRKDALEPLKDLKTKYGVYGIDGNHEYYSGYKDWLSRLKSYGIDMVENDNRILNINGRQLAIVGVQDDQGHPDVKKATSGLSPNIPKILLCHRPGHAAHNAKYDIDLQLSGHTHGGMMIGLNKLVIAKHNGGFVSGWYDVNKMKLYVSNGTSLWNGFPVRIGVPGEITLFTLRSAKK